MTPVVATIPEALRLSLGVAFWCTVVATPAAVAMGWLLARRSFPGKAVLTTVVYSPLVLPPVVTGFLLLRLLGRRGVFGGFLHDLGVAIPFTFQGAVLASLVVGFPLYVAVVRGAFEYVDRRYDEVALTLGLRPRTAFGRVTLPLALPGILAGAVLAFARALGEFGATIVLAGNVEGETRTISIAVYGELDSPRGEPAAWALVGVSLALCLAAMLGYEMLSRRHRCLLELDRGH